MKKIIPLFAILILATAVFAPFVSSAQSNSQYVDPETQVALSPMDGPLVVEIKRQISELKKMLSEFEALTTRLSREQNSASSVVTIGNEISTVPSLTVIAEDNVSADLNGDGAVDTDDLKDLTSSWGVCFDDSDCKADLDENGTVDIIDLKLLLKNWTN